MARAPCASPIALQYMRARREPPKRVSLGYRKGIACGVSTTAALWRHPEAPPLTTARHHIGCSRHRLPDASCAALPAPWLSLTSCFTAAQGLQIGLMRNRMGKRGVEADEDVVAASGMVSLPASPAAAMAVAVGHLGFLA